MHGESGGDTEIPGQGLEPALMPGHWLLARMGKRVLRPGGRELTGWMMDGLDIGPADDALEIAPGLGVTAEVALRRGPRTYVGVERDAAAARALRARIEGPGRRILQGSAERIDLPAATVTVAWAEAMLTMNPQPARERILSEVARVLVPGGRFGMHELMLTPDDLPEHDRARIRRDLSETIRVGARPLTASEWRELLATAGLETVAMTERPMALLSPGRVIRDEGAARTARILANVARDPVARTRVRAMRAVFRRHRDHIAAISIVARRAAGAAR